MGPEGLETRPITDRVKQSVFDILTPLLPGVRVYDCFAGTGSLGLEALSRGAEHVTFFEADRSAVGLLRRNVEALGVGDRCEVVTADLFRWFAGGKDVAPLPALPPLPVGVVFLDPPYRFLREKAGALQELGRQIAGRHLAADGVVVFRHDVGDALELGGLVRYDQREYGGMVVEMLRGSDEGE